MNETERIEKLLGEILKWTRFAGSKEVRNTLTAALDSDQRRMVYHLSDGTKGSVEIASLTGTSDRTVRRLWELWANQGIVDAVKVRGGDRYAKCFDLEQFGIRIPTSANERIETAAGRGNSTGQAGLTQDSTQSITMRSEDE